MDQPELVRRVARLESDMAQVLTMLTLYRERIEHLTANLEAVFTAHNRLVEKLAGGQRPTRPLN